MVEVNPIDFILPIAVALIVSLLLGFIKKAGKTSEGTLTGTIKLEYVSKELVSLEERIDKRFDKMEQLVESKDKSQSESITRIWQILEELKSGHKLNTWRLDEMEKKYGSGKSAV